MCHVTLEKYFSHPSLNDYTYFFPTPLIKLVGITDRWEPIHNKPSLIILIGQL
jgi:hypothetical protein